MGMCGQSRKGVSEVTLHSYVAAAKQVFRRHALRGRKDVQQQQAGHTWSYVAR